MGDTYRDPVDHQRTTRPHAGRAVIDVAGWPGYLMVALGVIATVGCLTALATRHLHQGIVIAVAGIIAITMGVGWLLVEHRRISRVTTRWNAAHQSD